MTDKPELDWCCIAAVNDEAVLRDNLAASPALVQQPGRLTGLRDQPSMGVAYNRGLDRTDAAICVFAHQDVYLPLGWDTRLAAHLSDLSAIDPDWAVAGVYGVGLDGAHAGRVWSSGLGKEIGVSPVAPVPVQSLDELVIVLRRSSGLRFDETLPSFHLYGTDIVQAALAAGYGAYVVDAPVVHNSTPVRSLRGGFLTAYDHLRKKWRRALPIVTPVTRITRFGMTVRWQHLRRALRLKRRGLPSQDKTRAPANPAAIARGLGYERPQPS